MKTIIKGSVEYFNKIKGLTFGKDKLDFININLPPICNYSCEKCLVGKRSKERRNYLKLDELKKLILSAKSLGAKIVTFTGEGEPLLITYFRDLVEFNTEQGLLTLLASNGSLLTEDMTNFLVKNNVTILLSLDSLRKDRYEKMCNVNTFDAVFRNIAYARRKFDEVSELIDNYKIVRFGIHATISSRNVDEIEELENFCGGDMGFSSGIIGEIGNAKDCKGLIITEENIKQKVKKTYFLMAQCQGKDICAQFLYGIDIGADGKILLDAHALNPEGVIVEDIRKYDYDLGRILPLVKDVKRKMFLETEVYCPIIRSKNYENFVKKMEVNANEKV